MEKFFDAEFINGILRDNVMKVASGAVCEMYGDNECLNTDCAHTMKFVQEKIREAGLEEGMDAEALDGMIAAMTQSDLEAAMKLGWF